MSSRYFSKRIRQKDEKKVNERGGLPRPKTFKSEEAAKKYAEVHKIKEYSLKNISTSSKNPKIKIIKK